MRHVFFAFSLMVCLLPQRVFGQMQHFQSIQFPVKANGKDLAQPFAGGVNQAQISLADLNADGAKDLVLFDRSGDVVMTFINNLTGGTSAYRYAPEFACFFPPCRNWMLLRDYDGDGVSDIFCASLAVSSQEVSVYKGYFEHNILKFKPLKFHYPTCPTCDQNIIYYPDDMPGFWNNLSIAVTDLPAIDDMDGDGDLDILTFEASVGGHVWLLENKSVEKGFGQDSLIYELTDRCWGDFYESGLLACKNCLSASTDECCQGFTGGGVVDDRSGVHPGSTLTTYDQDGDGDREIVLGDISFSCFNMMTNGGTKDNAWMVAQDTAFPVYSEPVDVANFPAAFYLDVDGDGANDMLVCPNSTGVIEDVNNIWFYKNTGTNANHYFELERKNLFTGDMLDLGSTTHPAFADVDGDGLTDMVVGNFGFYTPGNSNNARLFLYLNTGTHAQPKFQLADLDWLGMSQFAPNDYDFAPAFGDMDADGDLDLLVGGNGGWLYHYRNDGGPASAMQMVYDADPFWLTLDVGISATPFIRDMDGDNLPDLLIGERKGNINFFKNTGTNTTFKYATVPDIEKLGAMDVKAFGDVVGYAAPAVLPTADGLLIITGNQLGLFEAYKFGGITANAYELVSKNWGNTDVGARSHPAFADMDGDGTLELLAGNLRGGLNLFRTTLVDCEQGAVGTSAAPDAAGFSVHIFPNPARHWVQVSTAAHPPSRISHPYKWQVSNLLGQTLAAGEAAATGGFGFDVSGWQSGVYVLTVAAESHRVAVKLMVGQ